MSAAEWWVFLNSQFLGTFFLFATLLVLAVYAWDTRRIARASLRQLEIAREERERRDKASLASIAFLLLESTRLHVLYADKTAAELARMRWKILADASRAAIAIEDERFLSLCARVGHYAMHDGPTQEAIDLAGEALTLANPPLMKKYGQIPDNPPGSPARGA
jgi:hypothetical protein